LFKSSSQKKENVFLHSYKLRRPDKARWTK